MDRRPGQLSGGQQQRVALARAIAYQPAVFLFDEPLSNLDARLRLEARTFLKQLQRELGVTTVFVTHDQAEALAMADRIAVMEAGAHPPDRHAVGGLPPARPTPSSPNFIGSTPMNLLARAAPSAATLVPRRERRARSGSGRSTPTARPEHLVGRPVRRSTAQVSIVENLGASMLVSVEVGDHSVQALVPEGEEPPVDAMVSLSPRTGARAALPDGRRRAARTGPGGRGGSLTGDAARPRGRPGPRTTGPRTSAPRVGFEVPARRRRVPGRARLRPARRRGPRPRLRGAGRATSAGPEARASHVRGHARTGRPRATCPATAVAGDVAGAARPAPGARRRASTGSTVRARPTTRRGGGRAAALGRGARTAARNAAAAPRSCPASTGCGGSPATSTPTPLHSDGALAIAELAALGREPWSRLPGGHRPQHDQPPRSTCPPLGQRYGIAAAARAGGHHRPRARERVRRHRLGRLPRTRRPRGRRDVEARGGVLSVNHPLAADCCWRHRR